jgi:hypothetical protein
MTAERPMAAVIYLDVEDEITSAAARIRTTGERRLAIVLPAGSRVSTSRINFRLLAREATSHGRDLAIVAPEASARALAASAGIPVFASVMEYEDALASAPLPADDDAGPTGGGGPAAATGAAAGAAAVAGGPAAGSTGQMTAWWEHDDASAAAGVGAASQRSSGGIRAPQASLRSGQTPPSTPSVRPRTLVTDTVVMPVPDVAESKPRRRRVSGWILATTSVLIVLLLIGAVAGWLFLPSATITVAERPANVGPVQFTVRADPLAVNEDVANGVVPAQVVTYDVNVSQDFPATGKKVTETRANGDVQWTNCDPTRSYTIPSGTVVKDDQGNAFATTDSAFLPVAILTGNPPTITCQSRDVGVTAQNAGTAGNVAAGTITNVPTDFNSVVIRVNNAKPTSGGTHVETKIVQQKDVDAAATALTKALKDEFTTQLGDQSQVPAGLTLFPTTRSMSAGDPTVDPSTLVGQATPVFTLGMNATGTATAVDQSLVQSLGDQRIRSQVGLGESLVKDSVNVAVGTPRVDGSSVLFPVTARAQQVAAPDASAIRSLVKGLSVDEARQRLQDFGDATVDVWPGWVTTITPYDFRLDVNVLTDVPTEPTIPEPTSSPAPSSSTLPSSAPASSSASPAPSAAPTRARPTASPSPAPSAT